MAPQGRGQFTFFSPSNSTSTPSATPSALNVTRASFWWSMYTPPYTALSLANACGSSPSPYAG